MRAAIRIHGLALALAILALLSLASCNTPEPAGGDGAPTDTTGGGEAAPEGPGDATAASRAAFLAAYPVFMHARCRNCHPAGDAPLVGDGGQPHPQLVQRGTDGRGVFGMRCTACHQDANLPGAHLPPGVPDWRLPSKAMPLVFEGRSAADLAAQLTDPNRNGGKSLTQLLHHVEDDALVKWGWAPGAGRSVPPISHAAFVAKIREWIATGAHAPE